MEKHLDKKVPSLGQSSDSDKWYVTLPSDSTSSTNFDTNNNNSSLINDPQLPFNGQVQQLHDPEDSPFTTPNNIDEKEDPVQPVTSASLVDTDLLANMVPEEGEDLLSTLNNNKTESDTTVNDFVKDSDGNNDSMDRPWEQDLYLASLEANRTLSYGAIGNLTQQQDQNKTSLGLVNVNELEMVDFSSWLVGAICLLICLRIPYIKRFLMKIGKNQEADSSTSSTLPVSHTSMHSHNPI
ncbi:hypothetical protein BC941DRAFT_163265 [Chlamydoabsidia padenii]|nr:hypothetical protein BC941DRAFT_163265 [Chlamydoabsidia padenii]